MKLLTVSIAAYNVAPYLRQTLDSCVVPEIMDELEVLIVNDGSTDETPDIAREYEQKYPKTFRLLNKENGGYGTTVNLSMKEATGKYFKLLDGDDWFNKDGLKKLMAELKKTNADVLIAPLCKGAGAALMEKEPLYKMPHSKDFVIDKINIHDVYGMWHITYKTEILRLSGIELPAHRLYTDQLFATIPFAYAKNIRYIDNVVYCYRIGRDGQSVSRDSRIKHCQDAIDTCTDLVNFYETEKKKKSNNLMYVQHRIAVYFNFALRTILLNKPTRENLRKVREYNAYIKGLSGDIYRASNKMNAGKFMFVMHKTNFIVYLIFRGGVSNWQ